MEARKFEINEKPTTLVGSLKKTEYITVGHFQRCEIQKIISTDLVTTNKTTFVKLDLSVDGHYGTDIKSAALTFDEVEGLINSLIAFRDNVIITTPNVYTEVNYTTGDFKAGCYYSKQEWTVFLKIVSHDDESYIIINMNQINQLIGLLENTKL